MGLRVTPSLSALNYGYVSAKLRGRSDLDFYLQSLDYLLNYISTPQGELNFRGGSRFVSSTRNNNNARIIPFIYQTETAYIVEITEDYMRFYRNNGIVTETAQDITDITQADPAVVTYSGADNYANGDRIIITGVVGMHQVNGREFIVANVDTGANTFEITDVGGTDIDSTSYTAYASGGSVNEIVEISSPYQEEDLTGIDFVQTEDTMYIVHPDYEPRKLTRSSHTSWTLATFEIIGNPFGTTKATGQSITGITAANPAVVTYSGSDTYANGDTITISGVVGMTEVNGKNFTVDNVDTGANTFELKDYDSTDNTAYTSGGTIEEYSAFSYPSVVTLADGRIIYGASDSFPLRTWWSKIRDDGSLDDFTTGTLDNDAIIYNVRSDQSNRIRWIEAAESFIAIGTSGSELKASGGGENDAITPTNISVRNTSFNGVAAVRPLRLDNYILYLQRNGRTVRSLEYNALQDGYSSPDRTLLADQISNSKFKEFSYTAGTPNIIWAVRNDGKLAGLTFDPGQQVVSWHLHSTQGSYISLATIPESDDDDELWQVVQRTINSATVRYVEYTPNMPEIPVFEEYFTGKSNKSTDRSTWLSALWNVQKTMGFSDSHLVYDGRDAATVDLTITGTLTVGESVTVTASGSYFTAAMATDNRRIQSPNGGQIQIETYNSATEVEGTVLYDVESATLSSGEWYYMAQSIGGLWHLEGASVAVLADGGVVEGKTISNGEFELDDDAGYVIVGLGYTGIGKSQDLLGGSETGPAITKTRVLTKLRVKMRASLGTSFGSGLYDGEIEIPAYREAAEVAGRPPHLFSGVLDVDIPDTWNNEKHLYWLHEKPTPSNIQYMQAIMETNDD